MRKSAPYLLLSVLVITTMVLFIVFSMDKTKNNSNDQTTSQNPTDDSSVKIADDNNNIKQDYEYTEEEIEERLKNLDPASYHVVVEKGTEKPFDNEYWDNKAEGIYVDKVTGKPLFSSTHKYDSGTGWPSFYKTIDEDAIELEKDRSLGIVRTEVRSESGHLGHLFDDGPIDKGGQRFCMNSASMRFIAKEDMDEMGYGDLLYLFEENSLE